MSTSARNQPQPDNPLTGRLPTRSLRLKAGLAATVEVSDFDAVLGYSVRQHCAIPS
jgi:hypothetical protein